MRLYNLILINYIGIYNGMGLRKIEIDFSKCRNEITVIKGDNGSGKSTIFKALTPMSDSSDNFIPNESASKCISYQMGDGTVIQITYLYPISSNGTRKKTECHIIKIDNNGQIDLNPNGNVTEGKDMINTIFDFDQNFIALSQLSSDDRGLADKSPSDRKKFINTIIESMSVYNEIYKKLTKKSSALKMSLNSINSKISSIGNRELLNNRMATLSSSLDEMEARKTNLIARMGEIKANLGRVDPTSVIEERNALLSKIDECKRKVTLTSDSTVNELESKLDKDIDTSNTLSSMIARKESKIESIKEDIRKIRSEYQDKEIKLSYYNNSDTTNKNIKESIRNVKESIAEHEKFIASYKIKKELIGRSGDITAINNELLKLGNLEDVALRAHAIDSSDSDDAIHQTICKINNAREEINDINKRIGFLYGITESADELEVPKECKIKTCPLAIKCNDTSKYITELHNLNESLSQKQDKLDWAVNYLQYQQTCSGVYKTLNTEENKLLLRLINQQDIEIKDIMIKRADHNYDISSITDMENITSLLALEKARLAELTEEYMKVSNNESAITILKSDMDKLHTNLIERDTELKNNESSLSELTDKSNAITKHITLIKSCIISARMQKEIDSCIKRLTEIDKDYKLATKSGDEISGIQDELESLSRSSMDLKKESDAIKYKLVLYDEYIREYKEFSGKYNTVETVKKYASPTTGIQTVFMGMYMNDIISLSNQLLGMLFNGEYVLHPFVINANEFRIPCSGKGLVNDDISSMSTSQICMISMIISFALLHKSSSIYNIIKLDEMDGGLDSQNRVQFIVLLQKMMEILGVQQCVMISHNSELNMSNADVIILRNSDPDLHIDGNVIFRL